jgi:hypothetical protein
MNLLRWVAVLLLAAMLVTAGCGVFNTVTGSGIAESRDFDLSGFSGVQGEAAFEIQLSRADSYSVRVTADNNLWDVLDIKISGATLHLGFKSGVSAINTTLKASVAMPGLSTVELSGASQATVSGFSSGSGIKFVLSGASRVDIQDIETGDATFDISGASNVSGSMSFDQGQFVVSGGGTVNLRGSGTSGTIDASGGSTVDLDQLTLQTARATGSGGATIRVNAQNINRADLSGGARLFYVGNPVISNVATSGGASISKE